MTGVANIWMNFYLVRNEMYILHSNISQMIIPMKELFACVETYESKLN